MEPAVGNLRDSSGATSSNSVPWLEVISLSTADREFCTLNGMDREFCDFRVERIEISVLSVSHYFLTSTTISEWKESGILCSQNGTDREIGVWFIQISVIRAFQ